MTDRTCYLDYNATAPLRPEVIRAMTDALHHTGNPSSIHRTGREARSRIEAARGDIATLAGARPAEVIFTSGGTEANNLALCGAGRERVLVSAIEHDSVLRAVPENREIIPVLPSGQIDLAALEALLRASDALALVSVMLANNETGILQPVAQAAQIARAHGALLHCDAVQAAGKVVIDRDALGADFLTLSAHKFGGPQGIGALIAHDGLILNPLLRGGGQERGRRAGTENVAAIAGFAAAAVLAQASLGAMTQSLAELRDRLEAAVQQIAPQTVFFGRDQQRLPNTSNFALPGASAATQVMNLDLAGVAVSAGAACSSGKVTRSSVLSAMGVETALADAAIRISLGWASTGQDIDYFIAAWKQICGRANLRLVS